MTWKHRYVYFHTQRIPAEPYSKPLVHYCVDQCLLKRTSHFLHNERKGENDHFTASQPPHSSPSCTHIHTQSYKHTHTHAQSVALRSYIILKLQPLKLICKQLITDMIKNKEVKLPEEQVNNSNDKCCYYRF